MSAAQNVSRNVRRLRRSKGWTQGEAAERMSALMGSCVSEPSWSAGERAAVSGRTKSWTANEIAALAELFGVAIGELFLAPEEVCPACGGNPPAGFTCNACGGAR